MKPDKSPLDETRQHLSDITDYIIEKESSDSCYFCGESAVLAVMGDTDSTGYLDTLALCDECFTLRQGEMN